MAVLNEWFFPRGSLAQAGWEAVVDRTLSGWRYTGIRVAELDGAAAELPAAEIERIVIPLAGACVVDHEGTSTALEGRASVFTGPTDVLYVGAGQALTISGRGRVAVAESPASVGKPSRYLASADVPVELRGAGRDSRQVHNFGIPGVLDAAALIVCEVITPAGNWSSHPAHKHDESVSGQEALLEEIYYFEVAVARGTEGPTDADAFADFTTYSSSAGEIETRATVRTGDIALVPYGYHGPAAAAPEYDLYYLNVMAGPDSERAWLISDDPRQAWIRGRWPRLPVDARLPYTASGTGDTEEAAR
ncbi:MAG: 5-deoxy-glucuronate isomerase [Acidobacteriota bacterium]|nr:5-deoxy-glucuronate isomerase [Acidobacteriota bacterium]